MSQQNIKSFLNEFKEAEEFRVFVKDSFGKIPIVAIKVAINGSRKTFETPFRPCEPSRIYTEIVKPMIIMGLNNKIILEAETFENTPSNTHIDLPPETTAFLASKLTR